MDLVVKDARIRLPLSQIHSNRKGIIQHSFDEAKKAYCQQIILIILNLSYTNAYLTTVIGPQKLKYISYSFEVLSNSSVPAEFSFLFETYFRMER